MYYHFAMSIQMLNSPLDNYTMLLQQGTTAQSPCISMIS